MELNNQRNLNHNQEPLSHIEEESKEIHFPEGISFKAYLYVLKKFSKSSLEEDILNNRSSGRTRLIVRVAWGLSIGCFITFLVLTHINTNIFIAIFSLSLFTFSIFLIMIGVVL